MFQPKDLDTIVFLGAGASEFAGYRTFRDFGELILDDVLRYKENLPAISDETPRLISEVRSALERMHRPTTHDNYLWLLTDYHNFCEKFDTHTGLQARFPRIKDEVRSFDSASTTVIGDLTKTTFAHYSRPRAVADTGDEIRRLYEELAELNSRKEPFLPIFTTNYDLLIEDLFADRGRSSARLPLVNGIPGRIRNAGRWTPAAYDNSGIHLYRLHGCVAWFNEPNDNQIAFNRADEIDADLSGRLCVMFPGRELERGKDPHGFGFKALFEAMLACRRILFIGFSFRDDDVMHLLLAANATRSKPLKLLIIDPRVGTNEVLHSLRDAARRSIFRVKIPTENDVTSLSVKFGTVGVRKTVIDFVTANR